MNASLPEPSGLAVSEPAPPAPAPRPRLPAVLPWLLLAVTLALAGFAGWRAWQFRADLLEALEAQERLMHRLSRQLASVQSETEQLAARQDEMGGADRHLVQELASIARRLEESEQAAARLQETVQGGRARFQALAVEQLLLAANDRLLLAHDVPGARKALELADARLAALAEPRLLRVREAVAQERAALAALPDADLSGIALSLNALIRQADALPLAAQAPEHVADDPAAAAEAPAGDWPQRLWAKVRAALAQVFVVRRKDDRVVRLLAPEQEALVRQILALRLETARFAALRGEPAVYREAAQAALDWLRRYYKGGDPGVRAAQAELERLAAREPTPALPDISRSLALLRGALEAPPR